MLAKRFLLTGDPISAEEAVRVGLVAESTPDAESCREAGLAWAKRLAAGAPLAIQYTKQSVNAWIKQTAGSALIFLPLLKLRLFLHRIIRKRWLL